MSIDTLITIGFWLSAIGFLAASYITFNAMRKTGQSGMKPVLTYLFIGTLTFFIITIFQNLGAGFFGIADESMDIWWHVMFYLAMFSFYFGFKALSALGSSDSATTAVNTNSGKTWGIFAGLVLVTVFIIPGVAEPLVNSYTSSKLAELGLHHFIAFIMAGVVGAYLFSAKIFLGQIGKAIANPMLIAIWALSLQHFWELLVESWKVILVTGETGEGVEKIFLIIAAACICSAALRLQAFTKTTTAPAAMPAAN